MVEKRSVFGVDPPNTREKPDAACCSTEPILRMIVVNAWHSQGDQEQSTNRLGRLKVTGDFSKQCRSLYTHQMPLNNLPCFSDRSAAMSLLAERTQGARWHFKGDQQATTLRGWGAAWQPEICEAVPQGAVLSNAGAPQAARSRQNVSP